MVGEKKLIQLIKNMNPKLNKGEYVFIKIKDLSKIKRGDAICDFKEEEGTTIVIDKNKADDLNLNTLLYGFR